MPVCDEVKWILKARFAECTMAIPCLLSKEVCPEIICNLFSDLATAHDPRYSILNNELVGLPSAFIFTAEVDPLRDEAKALADKLKVGLSSLHALSHLEAYCDRRRHINRMSQETALLSKHR